MKYTELAAEYKSLLMQIAEMENVVKNLSQGSISLKTIHGNKYHYYQQRVGGRVESRSLSPEELSRLSEEIERRKKIEKDILTMKGQALRLKQAAKILDASLERQFLRIRMGVCADVLSSGEKKKALVFSDAMTSLEGVPASQETDRELADWQKGLLPFQDAFEKTLLRYHMI